MRLIKAAAVLTAMILLLTACSTGRSGAAEKETVIQLDDSGVTVDGSPIAEDVQSTVYAARDIVYYEAGKDFTYGEGTQEDAHSAEEAAAHTVVHITQPGTYRISGSLSKGQIAVDLGKEAKDDPEAVVTMVLDGASITCSVAPAVIFYNVYECGDHDAEKAEKDVDTSAAGARVVLADGSVNTVRGAYVARIYEPESVELNEEGTGVKDAKKLHKYDGAFYSCMSMEVTGEKKGTGRLTIHAQNEGMDSEMHLTLNGGNIEIFSGNDGVNTNEDSMSVATINGGTLKICVTGETGEGDGIDSNGWLVINGGVVEAYACASSADAGIDSDMGIHIGGGTVLAGGHMLDRIEDGGQTCAVLNFAKEMDGGSEICLKDEKGREILCFTTENDCSNVVVSSPELKEGNYTLWCGGQQMEGVAGDMFPGGFGGMGMPGFAEDPPAIGDEGRAPFDPGKTPEGEFGEFKEKPEMPEGAESPEKPEGGRWDPKDRDNGMQMECTTEFIIRKGMNRFSGIAAVE